MSGIRKSSLGHVSCHTRSWRHAMGPHGATRSSGHTWGIHETKTQWVFRLQPLYRRAITYQRPNGKPQRWPWEHHKHGATTSQCGRANGEDTKTLPLCQLILYRVLRRPYFAILTEWLIEEIAIRVSDDLLGPSLSNKQIWNFITKSHCH